MDLFVANLVNIDIVVFFPALSKDIKAKTIFGKKFVKKQYLSSGHPKTDISSKIST